MTQKQGTPDTLGLILRSKKRRWKATEDVVYLTKRDPCIQGRTQNELNLNHQVSFALDSEKGGSAYVI